MAYNSATDKNLVQYDVLTLKLDSSTNPKLVYKKSTATNKGLNPDYFSGFNTKLVNLLNKIESWSLISRAHYGIQHHWPRIQTSQQSYHQFLRIVNVQRYKALQGPEKHIDLPSMLPAF